MDFMHDTLADGRIVRVLTLTDSHTRESLQKTGADQTGSESVAKLPVAAAKTP